MGSGTLRPALPAQLTIVPLQYLATEEGALLKRGRCEFKIGTKQAAEAIRLILDTIGHRAVSPEDIYRHFSRKSIPAVKLLLAQLLDWHLLVPVDSKSEPVPNREASLDIFYWEYGTKTDHVVELLNRSHLTILGINCIARRLATALGASGVRTHTVVDHPLLRNLRLFSEDDTLNVIEWPSPLSKPLSWTGSLDTIETQCLVVTSDFGWSPVFEEANRFSIRQKVSFMPVILGEQIGRVGPLIVPGETACYVCLQARINSHLDNREHRHAVEHAAYRAQHVCGFHPSMASILGDIAALELTKFLSGALPHSDVGRLIEIDLLEPQLTSRKVLRIPRCPECSAMNRRASTNPERTTFTPSGWAGE